MLFKSFFASALLLVSASAGVSAVEPLKMELEKRGTGSATVIKTCKKSGTFALTFDDGPHEIGYSIPALLNKSKSKGSFFVNGANFRCIYDHADEIKARYKAGHLIGSHTWSHVNATKITAAQLNRQLTHVETALMKIIGVKPRFFRPPFGGIDAASLKVLRARGYYTVTWDFDGRDSAVPSLSAKQMIASYDALSKTYPKPHMSLSHEVKTLTANQVMPVVVPKLLKAGYKLVTVAECLGLAPYQVVGKPSARDATWTCAGLPGPGVP